MRPKTDSSWTLFLDRDGVINRRPAGYIKSWQEFEFLPGSLEAIKKLTAMFGKIIVVTNQQGVGKQLMTVEDLEGIHHKMTEAIIDAGGKLTAIYYCPDLESQPHNCRKPGIQMAEKARQDFPEIDFGRSIMAGDTASDMQFGIDSGMTTVYINTSKIPLSRELFAWEFPDLLSFAGYLAAND